LSELPLQTEAQQEAQLANVSRSKGLVLRIVLTTIALAIWFWTQSLIGAREFWFGDW
jgi:hypothetical protein